jgi:hypothetical protein
LVIVSTAQAQLPPVEFGVAGGLVLSNVFGRVAEGADLDYRKSAYVGLEVLFQNPASNVGVLTGLTYLPKGYSASDVDEDFDVKISYLEVPVLARIGIDLGNSNLTPAVLAGVSLGLNIGCDVRVTDADGSDELECDDGPVNLEAEIFSMAFAIGGTLDVAISPRFILSPTLLYTRGLTDIFGDEFLEVRHSVVQIGATLRLPNG